MKEFNLTHKSLLWDINTTSHSWTQRGVVSLLREYVPPFEDAQCCLEEITQAVFDKRVPETTVPCRCLYTDAVPHQCPHEATVQYIVATCTNP